MSALELWFIGFALLIFISAIDVWLTSTIIKNNGTEFNAVVRYIYKHSGVRGMVALKLFFFIFIAYFTAIQPVEAGGKIDLYAIFYLDFMIAVIMLIMFRDIRNTPGFKLRRVRNVFHEAFDYRF